MLKLLLNRAITSIAPVYVKISLISIGLLLTATLVLAMLLKASYVANGSLKSDVSTLREANTSLSLELDRRQERQMELQAKAYEAELEKASTDAAFNSILKQLRNKGAKDASKECRPDSLNALHDPDTLRMLLEAERAAGILPSDTAP